jgi:FkbM family methyltransferase
MDLARDITLAASLTRISRSGVKVASIVKIGAGSGADVPFVERYFPGSRTLLIDMDRSFEPQWKSLQAKVPTLRWAVYGAADEDRDGFMRKTNRTGGVITAKAAPDATPVSHRRLDTLVAEYGMPGPYFLRFDTHGAETLVLAGAVETLKHTSLIQMECYNFKHVLTFDKMVGHMRERGFRVIDMCEPLFRKDGAFWQIHLFFAREDHPAFKTQSYNVKAP